MTVCIPEWKQWPRYRRDEGLVAQHLAPVRNRQGPLIGRIEALGFDLRAEAVLATLTEDVLKSSEIEGEIPDKDFVRSSIARRLGMDIGALAPADRHIEAVVEMMLDATPKHAEPLTDERLFAWHTALFPTGRSGMTQIIVCAWRDEGSGPIGREPVHCEAPSAPRLEAEMSGFLKWFNDEAVLDPVRKAAWAHWGFVTIHPFDDGNGRIARTIADMALARHYRSCQTRHPRSRPRRRTQHELLAGQGGQWGTGMKL